MMISMALYSCSRLDCKLQKLNTVYFKSCGLAARAFNMLHALSMTMSQKTAHRFIEQLSKSARNSLTKDLAQYLWFGCHDNVNLGFKVYEQCMDNRDRFDSGTVATIIIIKDPACIHPNAFNVCKKLREGSKNPITCLEIFDLDNAAQPCLLKYAVYHVLKILIDMPEFEFNQYYYKDNPIFKHSSLTNQLPTGREHATCQYMLNTVHIEEASYEGNSQVLSEWFRQLRIDMPNKKKMIALKKVLPWVGDQLTISWIHGLKNHRNQDLNSYN
jgi:hypothetical protein